MSEAIAIGSTVEHAKHGVGKVQPRTPGTHRNYVVVYFPDDHMPNRPDKKGTTRRVRIDVLRVLKGPK